MSLFIDNKKILKFIMLTIQKVMIIVMMIIFIAVAIIINNINGFDSSCYDNGDINSGYNMLIGDKSGQVVPITNGCGGRTMIIILMTEMNESYDDKLIK